MKYRADIDGLRALAILPVVAFHLGIRHLPGGFVGVDIFFVISGYLITGHLLADIEADRFSLTRFYERRLRRIGPALIAVLVIVTWLALVGMLPFELRQYGASAAAAILSLSNVYFWSLAGYFDASALTKPLLHTWSLAVEEQYYLAFPVLLHYASRFSVRRRNLLLLGLTLASFLLSSWFAFTDSKSAFYLPHLRAWELLLGALLALGACPVPRSTLSRNLCTAIGLLLIVFSVLWIRETMPFPGLWALPPCLGACLILAGGKYGSSLVGGLLQFPPLVFIGLISYSLYLWHWPVIVFESIYFHDYFAGLSLNAERLAIVVASFILAIASWRFVERPFRDRIKVSVPALTWSAAATAASLLCISLAFYVSGGFAGRYPARVAYVASFLNYDVTMPWRAGTCFISSAYQANDFKPQICMPETPGKFLLLGDSHAAHLWPGLQAVADKSRWMQVTASGCKPLLPLTGENRCVAVMRELYDHYPAGQVRSVLLSARWTMQDIPALDATLDWWRKHGVTVVLIGPSPEYDLSLPRLLARAMMDKDPNLPARHLQLKIKETGMALQALAARKHIQYISMWDLLCQGARCETSASSDPLFFDDSHFTAAGSLLAIRRLAAKGLMPR